MHRSILATAVALGINCVNHSAAFLFPRQQWRCQAGTTSNSNWKLVWSRGEALSPTILLLSPGNKRRKKSWDEERNLEEGADYLPLTS